MNVATPRQVKLIRDLLREKDLLASPKFFDRCNAMDAEEYEQELRRLHDVAPYCTKEQASKWIARLLELPGVTAPDPAREAPAPENTTPAPQPQVPAGRYAVEDEGVLKFYKVDRPTEGRWAGRTFVSVQASDELHPLRNPTTRKRILALIEAAGPEQASARYGHELGRCGICNRTLTDEASRARGIGPVCAGKVGW